jgi:DNA-directed RNA polymerase subunit beta
LTSRSTSPDRFNFSALGEAHPLPNLLEIQRDSFDWFLKTGLRDAFAAISPISDFSGNLQLELEFDPDDADLKSPPKFTVEECRQRATTYSAPIFVRARFLNANTGEIKEQTVFMGDFPIMTEQGTFIINGTERVVVSQLVRSPGVIFQPGKDEKVAFEGTIHPSRGEWLQVDLEEKKNKSANAGARIARKRRVSIFSLLRALDINMNEEFFQKFVEYFDFLEDQFHDDWKKALREIALHTAKYNYDESPESFARASQETAWLEIYRRARPGEVQTIEAARQYFEGAFFSEKRYDLSRVGRYKLDRKLGSEVERNVELFGDLLDRPNPDLHVLSKAEVLATATYLLNLARDRTAKETTYHIDDQDHFANRRIRSVGELIQNALRTGLSRMERVVRERMNTQDVEAIAPQTLINIRPVMSAIKEFFATSQLSQFMDQNNPLSGLTHKRRLSALGPGGLSRERAGLEVRDVHSSHYGRMCPIETPEGPNVGLIGYLASYARINEYGFIETPYLVVKDGKVTTEVVYFTADEEEKFVIAQANTEIDANGAIKADRVLVRRGPTGTGLRVGASNKSGSTTSEIDFVPPKEVELMDVSPKQIISVATSLIPFVEHDDAQRALMGANMQKQAVPLVVTEAPFVGTGMEGRAALDSGDVLFAEGEGRVVEVSGDRIVVDYDVAVADRYGKKLGKKQYNLNKFRRSNQDTSINQKPLVFGGETVQKGDLLADGTSTYHGELALGKNLLVAYMPWEGYNYEDAIILNERLVRDDVLTSIHVKEYEIDARDTKLGAEEITRDIPNLPDDILADLDDRGIVRIGAEVQPGDILVGKVTPKGETEQSPEERLLRAIFGEKAREVRDTSLKVPHGESGKVIDVKVYSRDEDHEMQPGVNQLVKVYVAQRRKISEGDKLAGRHGNKGVISKILPEEDMPFLEDGTPVDIILSPLGVPSRMNVGQVLESHLGYAARHGWQGIEVNPATGTSGHDDQVNAQNRPYRKTRPRTEPAIYVATPAFDGAYWDETDRAKDKPTIQNVFSKMNADGANGKRLLNDSNDGKVTLYNGRTGEAYDNRISVGYAYILKLAHMVDDKIHARSTGPYSMITAQPLGGKAQFGGQRFGEMEVWALEAYGAAYALQELLTVKSDDMKGRERAYEAIVKGQNLPEPGIPESFKVLIKEMQSLCLNVEVKDKVGVHVDLADTEEDFFSVTRELGIDISRPERGSDEEDARRQAERKSTL